MLLRDRLRERLQAMGASPDYVALCTEVLGVRVRTGRNGHAPGGVWLHLDIGGGLLYTDAPVAIEEGSGSVFMAGVSGTIESSTAPYSSAYDASSCACSAGTTAS